MRLLTATAALMVFLAAPNIGYGTVSKTQEIDSLVTHTQHIQRVVGTKVTRTNRSYRRTKSNAYRLWVLHYWQKESKTAYTVYANPPHKEQWNCIHRYEGSWSDSGEPYYGGLQMDYSFQRHYGGYLLFSKGTADHWSPFEQMWVAEHAYSSGRGFYPWPNTARYCGLL